jgi:Domain of unknown function (DUF4381)
MVDDIYDIWEPLWWQQPKYWLWSVVCMVSMVVVVVWYRRRKMHMVTLSPYEKAYAEISLLCSDTTRSQKEIYVAMIAFIKQYYAQHMRQSFSHYTDDELIMYVERQKQDAALVQGTRLTLLQDLIHALHRALQVKFAGGMVDDKELKHDVELVHRLYKEKSLDTSGKL